MPSEDERLDARTRRVAAAANEIIGILAECMLDADDPAAFEPEKVFETMAMATWQASQCAIFRLEPAEYVRLMRIHLEHVERLCC